MKFKETCLMLINNWMIVKKNKSCVDETHANNLAMEFICKQLQCIQEIIKHSRELEDNIKLSDNVILIYYQCIPLHLLALCVIAKQAEGLMELFEEIKNIVFSNFYGVFIDNRLIRQFFTHAEEAILGFLKDKITAESDYIKVFSMENLISRHLFELVNTLFKIQHLVINCRTPTQRVNAIVELCKYSDQCVDQNILKFNRLLVDYLAVHYPYNELQRSDIQKVMPLLYRNDQNISDSAVIKAASKLAV